MVDGRAAIAFVILYLTELKVVEKFLPSKRVKQLDLEGLEVNVNRDGTRKEMQG